MCCSRQFVITTFELFSLDALTNSNSAAEAILLE